MFKGKWNCLGSFTRVVFIHQQTLFVLSFANFLKFAGVYVQAWEVVAGLASRGAAPASTIGAFARLARGAPALEPGLGKVCTNQYNVQVRQTHAQD
jgi:hypothetical protein